MPGEARGELTKSEYSYMTNSKITEIFVQSALDNVRELTDAGFDLLKYATVLKMRSRALIELGQSGTPEAIDVAIKIIAITSDLHTILREIARARRILDQIVGDAQN